MSCIPETNNTIKFLKECKISSCMFQKFYVRFMANTKHKPTVDSQQIGTPLWKIINSQRKVAKEEDQNVGTKH